MTILEACYLVLETTSFKMKNKTFILNMGKPVNIYNLAKKLEFFKQNLLDYVFILPFNQKICNFSADYFVKDLLFDKFKMRDLVIGYDFTFGKNRQGNYDFLQKQSQILDFSLEKLSKFSQDGILCSSTKVREFLKEGTVKEANFVLGKNYRVFGRVIHGQKLAREIGFATLNLQNNFLLKPKFGVYKTIVFIESGKLKGRKFQAITNFGVKPTFGGNFAPIFESHLLSFDGTELYGEKIAIEFLDFIRGEKKFASLKDLKSQISKDISQL